MSEGNLAVDVAPTATSRPEATVQVPVLDLVGERTSPWTLLVSIWRSRFLIATLARKDFFVRYRRATFGVLWAVALPLIQALVMAVVFSQFIPIHTAIPRPVFMFTGVTAYGVFQTTLNQAATAIVDGAGLSSRIYFPRAILPLTNVGANMYSFVASMIVLLILSISFRVWPGVHTLILIPAIVMLFVMTAAFALVLSALHVYFRDVRYIVQALLLAMFYATPVFYPLHRVPERFRALIEANPMTGVVEMFRASIGGADRGWVTAALISGVWAIGAAVLGVWLQARWDRVFADLL